MIVRHTAVQRTGKHPILYIRHCVVSLCPQGLQQTRVSKHHTHGTGEYPYCTLSDTIQGRMIWDGCADLDSFILSEMTHLAHRQLAHIVCHDLLDLLP